MGIPISEINLIRIFTLILDNKAVIIGLIAITNNTHLNIAATLKDVHRGHGYTRHPGGLQNQFSNDAHFFRNNGGAKSLEQDIFMKGSIIKTTVVCL
jgi:hypothetical protein